MGRKKKNNDILLFCYGTLKSGQQLHGHLEQCGARLIGNGTIIAKDFVMRDLGAYPALQKVAPGSGDYQHGEIYLLDKGAIALLDRVEGYPNHYTRSSVKVTQDKKEWTCIVYYIEGTSAKMPGSQDFLWSCPVIKMGLWPPIASEESEEKSTEEINSFKPSYGFTVERGIYITTNWGEHYGPFKTAQDACDSIPYIFTDTEDIKTLTIGFRAFKDGLNQSDLEEIDQSTLQVC